LIAASLKHHVVPAERAFHAEFRDPLIAAPLKLLVAALAVDVVREIPRSIDRGPIEACSTIRIV